MFKKILAIFNRDFLSSKRDAMAVYIMVIPIILAIGISLLAPGLNDTTVSVALLKSDNQSHIDFMEDFAKVVEITKEEYEKK